MGIAREVVPDLVQLVDGFGNTAGQADLAEAHTFPGRPHRGFSVFLIDAWARLLIQRRSAVRSHSAGLWDSSCGGHPLPGESTFHGAWRQLGEGMGVEPFGLNEVGAVCIRLPVPGLTADDQMIEHEWHHVFVGMTLNTPEPDLLEAVEHRFVPLDRLETEMDRLEFTSWFRATWQVARPLLSLMVGRPAAGSGPRGFAGRDD